jgi:hypothetical protein
MRLPQGYSFLKRHGRWRMKRRVAVNHKWKEIKRQENLRVLAAILLTALLLFILAVAGTLRNGKMEQNQTEAAVLKADASNDSERSQIASPKKESEDIPLTQADQEFLNSLKGYFESGDLEGAARLLDGYGISWSEFPCMYDGTTMSKKILGTRGLVFLKPSTVFSGEFLNGKPEGSCTALQVITLDEGKRYDYSYGTWSGGKMNGSGASGYNYYDGAIGDINRKSAKEGGFKDDQMEGEVTYTSTNTAGETTKWMFQTLAGKIVLDDRWIQENDSQGGIVFKLMADQDEKHAYTLSESSIEEDRWKNFIEFSTD